MDCVLAGSNDGITWVNVYSFIQPTAWANTTERSAIGGAKPSNTIQYLYYRLIVKEIQ